MEKLTNIYNKLNDYGVVFRDVSLPESDAAVMEIDGNYILITDSSKFCTTSEELVAITHEAGHILTGSMHTLSNRDSFVKQHESKANRWAIKELLPFADIQKAMNDGYTSRYELANYFGVTEAFVQLAYDYYKNTCGFDFE